MTRIPFDVRRALARMMLKGEANAKVVVRGYHGHKSLRADAGTCDHQHWHGCEGRAVFCLSRSYARLWVLGYVDPMGYDAGSRKMAWRHRAGGALTALLRPTGSGRRYILRVDHGEEHRHVCEACEAKMRGRVEGETEGVCGIKPRVQQKVVA